MASSSAAVRSWRTAFLTLRDETLAIGGGATPSSSIPDLLQQLVFSHSQTLLSAAPHLPPHEVTSDVLFLLELVASNCHGPNHMTTTFSLASNLIHDSCRRVSYEISSSSWTLILDSFTKMLEYLFKKVDSSANAARITSIMDCLETVRRLTSVCHRKLSPSEDNQLVEFLLRVIVSSHSELICSSHLIRNQKHAAESGYRVPRYSSLWEVQTVAFTMLGEIISRDGSCLLFDVWKPIVEVIRKVVDFLASKSLLVEDNVMTRFYASLLHCLHLVLVDPKCSLSDHVTGFVVALRLFLNYGLSRTQLTYPTSGHHEKEINAVTKSSLEEPKRVNRSPYRPPHLRKMGTSNVKEKRALSCQNFSDHESSSVDFASSDSDYSDSDGLVKDSFTVQNSKVRLAAIVCIQDLCQADSKSFTTQWTLLLPTSDVLQPRKFEATLMTCLLYDPYLKVRIASASALAAMLDGTSSIFLQVAE